MLLHIKKKKEVKGINIFRPLFPKSIDKRSVHKYGTKSKKIRVIDFNFLEMVEIFGADKKVGLNTTLQKA